MLALANADHALPLLQKAHTDDEMTEARYHLLLVSSNG
jgi:hypothetical protein